MDQQGWHAAVSAVTARYHRRHISRREALRLLAGLGLTTGSAIALVGRDPAGARGGESGGHTGHYGVLAQEGTPPPVVTPQLGQRPDGTTVWRVQVGAFDPAELIEAMGFFPGEITVNVGDAVWFDFSTGTFHAVTFPSGEEYPRLIIPDEAAGTPAAGAGIPRLILNPQAAFPAGDGTYDGTGYVNSGTPDPTAPPFVVTFTAPGRFEYLCLVHPMPMKGTVTVQEEGTAYPYDQAAYDRMAAEQAATLLEEGRALVTEPAAATPAAATGVWEVAAGVGGEHVEAYRFLPKELTIAAGDTVRWTNRSRHDPHTVTFLGGEEAPEFISVEPQEGGPPTLVLNPAVIEPVGGSVYDGTGLTNSGLLGQDFAEIYEAFPRKGEVTFELSFDTPGEYRYYCAIHAGGPDDPAGMVGTVTVT